MTCSQYAVMIHLSEQVRQQNRYNLYVRHLQVIVKSYGQHTYLSNTLKYSRPEYKRNTFVSSFVLQILNFNVEMNT